jgi:hypothetical protein
MDVCVDVQLAKKTVTRQDDECDPGLRQIASVMAQFRSDRSLRFYDLQSTNFVGQR